MVRWDLVKRCRGCDKESALLHLVHYRFKNARAPLRLCDDCMNEYVKDALQLQQPSGWYLADADTLNNG